MATYDTYVSIWGMESMICVPAGVIGNQIAAVALKYLKETPAKLHEPASALITQSLVAAFPCI